MRELPPNPPTLRRLKDAEYKWLQDQNPGSLWSAKHCRVCQGTKTLRTYDHSINDIIEFPCDCIEQRLLHLVMLEAGIKMNYQLLGRDDIDDQVPPPVMQAFTDYCDKIDHHVNLGQGITFYGKDRGTGKSMLATLIAKHAIFQGYRTHFVTFRELVDSYQQSWKSDESRFLLYRSTRVLVIDELKTEGGADFLKDMLESVVRHRVAANLPTIITTNLDPEQLKHFGDGVMSLWDECNTFVEVAGAHFRKKKTERDDLERQMEVRRPVVLR